MKAVNKQLIATLQADNARLRGSLSDAITANTILFQQNAKPHLTNNTTTTPESKDVTIVPIGATVQSILAQNLMAIDQQGEQLSIQELQTLVDMAFVQKDLDNI